METIEQANTEVKVEDMPLINLPIFNKMQGRHYLFVLLGVIIVSILIFLYLKYQDRQNGYYGIYTLNFETREITANTDEYVVKTQTIDPIIVGIDLVGINNNNIKEVKWMSTDFNNGNIFETKYSSGINDAQYFAIPRKPMEYGFGAEITYNDGTTVKSSDYFTGPALTIWPDSNNPFIPIASLKSDKNSVSLQEEIVFDVITKTAEANQDDFQKNKQILWDFDGDGTRDRTTQGTSTRYRYLNSNPAGIYHPEIAVLYRGFTGSALGEISIR